MGIQANANSGLSWTTGDCGCGTGPVRSHRPVARPSHVVIVHRRPFRHCSKLLLNRCAEGRKIANIAAGGEAEPSRQYWQFTLRELLLFMLACVLLMALFVSNRPLAVTRFFSSLYGMPDDLVKTACGRLGLQATTSGLTGARSASSAMAGFGRESEEYLLKVESPPAIQRCRVIDAVQAEIERRLQEEGCVITGKITSAPPRNGPMGAGHAFLNYEHGKTNGTVRLHSVLGNGESWTLVLLVDEFRK